MKKLLIYLIITALCAIALCAAIMQTSKVTSTSVSVLWDKTDTMLSVPDPKKISALYNLSGNNLWNGSYFSYASITDVDLNYRSYAILLPANMWSGNELRRKKDVNAFFQKVDSILFQSGQIKSGKPRSSIYRTVIAELTRLKSESAATHTLLIYSDLSENSDLFDVYDPCEWRQLALRPDGVRTKFEKDSAIPDLTGITVYILFEPRSEAQDRTFRMMSSVYSKILTSHGAKVLIQANL